MKTPKLALTGINADLLLKGDEAVIYLNYVQNSGFDSLDAMLKSYLNEIDKLKAIIQPLTDERDRERRLNLDIKRYMEDPALISTLLRSGRVSRIPDTYPRFESLKEYLEALMSSYKEFHGHSYNRRLVYFSAFLSMKIELNQSMENLGSADYRLHKMYKEKLSRAIEQHKSTFWRRVISKLLHRK